MPAPCHPAQRRAKALLHNFRKELLFCHPKKGNVWRQETAYHYDQRSEEQWLFNGMRVCDWGMKP